MKFGLPTLIECRDVRECSDLALSLGLDFVEINMSFPQYLPQALSVSSLDRLRTESGIDYTVHMNETVDPFDYDLDVSAACFKVAEKTIAFARALGIRVVNMHLLPGVYVTLPDRRVYLHDTYLDEYSDKVRRFGEMCARAVGDSNLKICIENTDTPKNGWTSACRAAIDCLMDYDVFGLTLDTGHDFIADHGDMDVFDKYRDRIYHMHLHDASHDRGAHLALGNGGVDINGMLGMARERDASCLIEVKTVAGLNESAEYLQKRGYIGS
ncbi:MAG: sugar phosphate isomerase/epimerase [Clostridia bacterium]|nr:sugar phosphate isomerase/epimerase [Clostridia bacterium]